MAEELSDRPACVVFKSRHEMGEAAAALVDGELRRVVGIKGKARMVMACAPSQDEFYEALVDLASEAEEIWRSVEIFHMDEYVGLAAADPRSFRSYLQRHFLEVVEVGAFHGIAGEAEDVEEEARRYAALLMEDEIDVISMGIGENGHVAFNDPPVADFDDPVMVKRVELDPICRQQQVNDGCFPSLDEVPTEALSLTLPVFAGAGMLVCIVPGERKAGAVKDALHGPVGTDCPATLLRQHGNAHLLLDMESASLLDE